MALERFAAFDSNVAGTPAAPSNSELLGNYIVTNESLRTSGMDTTYSVGITAGGYHFSEKLSVKASPSSSGVSAFSTSAHPTPSATS